jgi:hypothetical protein
MVIKVIEYGEDDHSIEKEGERGQYQRERVQISPSRELHNNDTWTTGTVLLSTETLEAAPAACSHSFQHWSQAVALLSIVDVPQAALTPSFPLRSQELELAAGAGRTGYRQQEVLEALAKMYSSAGGRARTR